MAVTIDSIVVVVLNLLAFHLFCSIDAYSHTWGYANKYASPIYNKNIYLKGEDSKNMGAFIDITYPELGCYNDYTITAMHATDDMQYFHQIREVTSDNITAVILSGGIGFNFTLVRFHSPSIYQRGDGIRIKFAIYGLDLV